ncbi:MAG: BspA family leucine-rich repeat surface protein, partial [Ekhidna sp.]|nr:BspA family leucine-rich repeat surface protein [Ekhidna sp.]
MDFAFDGCSNLTIAEEAGVPDFSNVINMFGMFRKSSLSGDLSKWDVSSVIEMGFIFNGSDFNGDLSEWDISNVKSMVNMFLDNSSMSSENYDKLLVGWSTLNEATGETKIPPNIIFNAPDKYSCRGKAGRDALTSTHSWTISDDELISIRTEAAALQEVTAPCEVTDLTPPTAKSSCTMGGGTTVTAAHDVSNFPITESTLVTWTYTHNSKSIVQTQTVTIQDTEAPRVTGNLPEVTSQCPINAENELTKPPAPADNCKGPVNVAIKEGTSFPLQAGTTTITWVYTDDKGNTSEQTQEVTIKDTMPPEVTGSLAPVTAQCPLNAENEL